MFTKYSTVNTFQSVSVDDYSYTQTPWQHIEGQEPLYVPCENIAKTGHCWLVMELLRYIIIRRRDENDLSKCFTCDRKYEIDTENFIQFTKHSFDEDVLIECVY